MVLYSRKEEVACIEQEWAENPRWRGILRTYTAEDVVRLRRRGRFINTQARTQAEALWQRLQTAGRPSTILPLAPLTEGGEPPRPAPLIADAEAGLGGVLNAYAAMGRMIESGVAGAQFEDRLWPVADRPHATVLIPSQDALQKLVAARMAADVADVPTLLLARTDAGAAEWLSSDHDDDDRPFCTGERSAEGFCRVRPGLDLAIARGLSYAPYADLVGYHAGTPDLAEARRFAEAIHARFPGKLLAYSCQQQYQTGPFRRQLSALGYRVVTLAAADDVDAPRHAQTFKAATSAPPARVAAAVAL